MKQQTALITGASKRIGKAVAEFLAANGWSVVIHYNRSADAAGALSDRLSKAFPEQDFPTIKADLSDAKEIAGLIPRLVSRGIRPDLLVNNASVFDRGYLLETSTELFNSQLDVNLKAPFILMRDFGNYCKQGNIINLVDTRVTANKSNFAAYSISKKALWELTKMAALELAPKIRVNAIAPGVTLAPAEEGEAYLEKLAEGIPMKRPGGLKPIIQSLEYILTNTHLTGQLLFTDGGENLGTNV